MVPNRGLVKNNINRGPVHTRMDHSPGTLETATFYSRVAASIR